MKTSEFFFDLPRELIAQNPSEKRGASRLLVLNRTTGSLSHSMMKDFPDYVQDNTLVVVNNSKVRKARLYGKSETGGMVEFLLTKRIDDTTWLSIVSKKKKQHKGKKYIFPGNSRAVILEEEGDLRRIRFSRTVDDEYLDQYGHIPLPPYIKRKDTEKDWIRYQTIYAENPGSTAAPTAGLHFTEEILHSLQNKGVSVVPVTLHVGMGTFIPVRTENIEDHQMHEEEYEISSDSAEQINNAIREGKTILAVGTTSVRTLESAWKEGKVLAGKRSTDIFIYPGYRFKVVNQMLTNFHTPDSSLIVLVSAFAGKEQIKTAYAEAIERRYRFFSYGDAMFIQ